MHLCINSECFNWFWLWIIAHLFLNHHSKIADEVSYLIVALVIFFLISLNLQLLHY